jgi:hypothetical protein
MFRVRRRPKVIASLRRFLGYLQPAVPAHGDRYQRRYAAMAGRINAWLAGEPAARPVPVPVPVPHVLPSVLAAACMQPAACGTSYIVHCALCIVHCALCIGSCKWPQSAQ